MPPAKRAPSARGSSRREEILDAAVELFARKGYRGTGLLALAERVGISHVGILHHFGSKEGLLLAVMARRHENMQRLAAEFTGKGIAGLSAIPVPYEDEILTRLEAVLRAENLEPGEPLHEHFDAANQWTRGLIAAEIARGQQQGEIRSDIDPDLKAAEIVAFGIGIETQWLLNPDKLDRRAVHESFIRALMDDLTRADAPRRRGARKRTPPGG